MRIVKIIVIILFISVSIYTGRLFMYKTHQNIVDEAKAIQIANNYIKKLSYNSNEMIIQIDPDNVVWEKFYLNRKIQEGGFIERFFYVFYKTWCLWLNSKEYWAIHCGPRKIMFGGDLWVLIDKKTGRVLWKVHGE